MADNMLSEFCSWKFAPSAKYIGAVRFSLISGSSNRKLATCLMLDDLTGTIAVDHVRFRFVDLIGCMLLQVNISRLVMGRSYLKSSDILVNLDVFNYLVSSVLYTRKSIDFLNSYVYLFIFVGFYTRSDWNDQDEPASGWDSPLNLGFFKITRSWLWDPQKIKVGFTLRSRKE